VFTARYGLSPYIKQIRCVFKGFNIQKFCISNYMKLVCFVWISEQKADFTL